MNTTMDYYIRCKQQNINVLHNLRSVFSLLIFSINTAETTAQFCSSAWFPLFPMLCFVGPPNQLVAKLHTTYTTL